MTYGMAWGENTLQINLLIQWEDEDSVKAHFSIEKVTRLLNTPYLLQKGTEDLGDFKIEFGNFHTSFNLSFPPRVKAQTFSLYVPEQGENVSFSLFQREKESETFSLVHSQTLDNIQPRGGGGGGGEEEEPSSLQHTEIFRGTQSHFNILFLGEGFTLDEKEDYTQHISTFAQGFLNHPLISPHREKFSLFRSDVFSTHSGIHSFWEENKTSYDSFKLNGMIWSFDQSKILETAGPHMDAIIVVTNSNTPSGVAYYGNYAVISKAVSSRILVHEFSHLVLGVCDEYEGKNPSFKLRHASFSPNVGSIGKNRSCLMNNPEVFSTYCEACSASFQRWVENL
ncbi:MAG: hypothetical protein A3D19_09400 [Deltaproteobacteria bacterium RIFCSPHIGHO2_02_FULL_38_15]|nr:MAG: hypothetical protein A3D19_09400 [Deltaproteobacteria bacterium RIFCSPHIGHO2_02_FULL_38_15]